MKKTQGLCVNVPHGGTVRVGERSARGRLRVGKVPRVGTVRVRDALRRGRSAWRTVRVGDTPRGEGSTWGNGPRGGRSAWGTLHVGKAAGSITGLRSFCRSLVVTKAEGHGYRLRSCPPAVLGGAQDDSSATPDVWRGRTRCRHWPRTSRPPHSIVPQISQEEPLLPLPHRAKGKGQLRKVSLPGQCTFPFARH